MWKGGYLHRESRLFGGLKKTNVRPGERWLSTLLGLGLFALMRRRWAGRAAALFTGGLLLRRGLTGRCPFYKRFRLSSL